jgi:hypothetical protein
MYGKSHVLAFNPLPLSLTYLMVLTRAFELCVVSNGQSEELTSLANAVGAGMEAANTSIHAFVLRHAEVQLQLY